MAVAVDGFRPEEDLQVAGQVPDDEQEQDKPVTAMTYFLPSDDLKTFVAMFMNGPGPDSQNATCRAIALNLRVRCPGQDRQASFKHKPLPVAPPGY